MKKSDPFHELAEQMTTKARQHFDQQAARAHAQAAARIRRGQRDADAFWMEKVAQSEDAEGFLASLLAGFFSK